MKFNIIGAGRLGKSLALSLHYHSEFKLAGICSRTLSSAQAVVDAVEAGQAVSSVAELPPAELLFITTSDDAITTVVTQLVTANAKHAGDIIAHCSGSLSSEVLKPLNALGNSIASIHPLKAFSQQVTQGNALQRCDCVLEGDKPATQLLTKLFTGLGAQVIQIDPAKKGIYHAAAVIASNYLVTLASCSVQLFHEAGIPATHAAAMVHRLMNSSLANLEKANQVADALTGPLARGDLSIITNHLQAIEDLAINALYRTAGLATLPLTTHDQDKLAALRLLLKQE